MKYEWKKNEKDFYLPKSKPIEVKIPKFKYFTLSGEGNPNSIEFSEKISALFSLSYAIRMMPKSGFTPPGYFEYTVYPLEGVWDLSEKGRKENSLNKDELIYKIMIRQPDFVSDEIVKKAILKLEAKKPNKYLQDIKFEQIEDGHCVQMMHIGSFDDEPASFNIINEFLLKNGLEKTSLIHREIYISNFNKTPTEKLKTVLRVFVKPRD